MTRELADTMPPPVRDCSCCREPLEHDDWARMPYVGLQDDGDGGHLAMFNHSCGSTLVVPR